MLIDSIAEFQAPYTLTKFTGQSTSNGYITKEYAAPSTIYAVIQPMTDEELRNVPEGQNTQEWLSIWTTSVIGTNDLIEYNSVEFTVQKVSLWHEGLYYKASAVHIEETL